MVTKVPCLFFSDQAPFDPNAKADRFYINVEVRQRFEGIFLVFISFLNSILNLFVLLCFILFNLFFYIQFLI